ncbi:MAG: sigma-70 family RNA polymerase sigma factor [Anaerolineae bacterium]
MTAQSDTDLSLVRAMAQGNRQALTDLYQRHGRSLLAYLIGQLGEQAAAEEVLQDVMLAAWQSAPNFRGDSKVRTWLLAIARRKVINVWRKRKVTQVPLQEELLGAGEPMLNDRDAVREALRELSEDQREVLELIFYHELSGVEAAEVMGVSVGTVKSRLHRAKARMRGLLLRKELGDDY